MSMLEREDFHGGNSASIGPVMIVGFIVFVGALIFGGIWLGDRDNRKMENECTEKGIVLDIQTRYIDGECFGYQNGHWDVIEQ